MLGPLLGALRLLFLIIAAIAKVSWYLHFDDKKAKT